MTYIGKKYNMLTILERTSLLSSKGRLVPHFKCQCDCGVIKTIHTGAVISGNTKSCGHFKRNIGLIPKGTKIGFLTIGDRFIKNDRNVYTCFCICGKTVTYSQDSLHSHGRVTSCGCKRRKNQEEIIWGTYIKSYINGAKDRGLKWELQPEQVKTIATSPCHYCSAPPRRNDTAANHYKRGCISSGTTKKWDKDFYDSKIIYTNGIDRLDSSLGYVIKNVVPCCYPCNRGKSSMLLEEWYNYLDRLVKFRSALLG